MFIGDEGEIKSWPGFPASISLFQISFDLIDIQPPGATLNNFKK